MGVIEWIQSQLHSNQDSGDSKSRIGVHRDFMVRRSVAVGCLDKMSDGFNQMNLHIPLNNILVVAVSMARRNSGLHDNIPACIDDDNKPQDRRGIIRFVELGEKNLAYLFAEAILEVGTKRSSDLAELISLWEKWADEGLQILYCGYYSEYFSSSPMQFFDLLLEPDSK